MSVDVTKLRKLMGTRTLASGADFDFVFYSALNDVIRDIEAHTVLEVDEIDEDDPDSTIDVESKYFGVFASGVRWYMSRFPKWASVADDSTYAEYMRDMAIASQNALDDEDGEFTWDYENDDDGDA